MATQSAQENIFETLREYLDVIEFEDSKVEQISESIAKNLCIEYQKFPKWE